jgi:hypothetical protein
VSGCPEGAYSEEGAHRITNLLAPIFDVLIFHTSLRIIKNKHSSLMRNGIHLGTACEDSKFRTSAALAVCIRNVQFALCLYLSKLVFVIGVVYFLQYSLYSRLLEFTITVISVSQVGFYTHTNRLYLVSMKQNVYHKGLAILKISAEFTNQ